MAVRNFHSSRPANSQLRFAALGCGTEALEGQEDDIFRSNSAHIVASFIQTAL
jgi:hypothetical protein